MDMKVTVIMEKASDGYYSCFVEERFAWLWFGWIWRYGRSCKEDMMKAYEEIKEMQAEEGKKVPELGLLTNMICSLFQLFLIPV